MSAPSYRSLETENLTHGFLAAQAKSIIDRRIHGATLTSEDERLLSAASDFVEKLAAGEQLIETGCIRGQYSRGSIKTLRLLSDPIQSLAKVGRHPTISSYLTDLSQSLKPERMKTEPVDTTELQSARQFFEIVYSTICDALARNRAAHKRSPQRGA